MATDYTADANCRGAWLFADDLIDASGEGNTLADNGSIAYSTDRPSGYSTGKSADFDGSTDSLSRANADLSTNFPGKTAKQDWAYGCWFKADNLSSGASYLICKAGDWRCAFEYVVIYDNLRHRHYDSGWSEGQTDLKTSIATGTWYHLMVSLNGDGTDTVVTWWLSTTSFGNIINGSNTTLTGIGDVVAYTNAFSLGAKNSTQNFYAGHIYQPIVFDRTVSAAEAEEMHTNGINGAEGAVGNPYYAYAQQ